MNDIDRILTKRIVRDCGRDPKVWQQVVLDCRHAAATEMLAWRDGHGDATPDEETRYRMEAEAMTRGAERFTGILFTRAPQPLQKPLQRALFKRLAEPEFSNVTQDLWAADVTTLRTHCTAIELTEAANEFEDNPHLMEHVRQRARSATALAILSARKQDYAAGIADIALKAVHFNALAEGAKLFGDACAEGIPLRLDRDLGNDLYKILIRHRSHAFTGDLFIASNAQLEEELNRIEAWSLMERLRRDTDLGAELLHGLRYTTAHILLTRHWRDAALPAMSQDEIADIQRDALAQAAETLSRTHDLAVSRTGEYARMAETQMVLMKLAENLLPGTRDLFAADHAALGAALALSGMMVLNDALEEVPVSETELTAGIDRAAAIITSARKNGFAFEDIGKLHLDVPGQPPLRLI